MATSVLSRSIEFLPPGPLAWVHYVRKFGRFPRLHPPITFNEHITHSLIYDRNPLLKTACDKIAVKGLIAERTGEQHVVPLIGSWARVDDIPWAELPDRFVLKPSFTSGAFEIVEPDTDRQALAEMARRWMPRRPPHRHYREWGYQGVPRRIMAEPLITGEGGGPAPEVDVHVFNGRAQLLRVMTGKKLTQSRRDAWFDRGGRQVTIKVQKVSSVRSVLDASTCQALIEVAERIARGFTFLRVDTYLSSQGIKIGELTAYPWGGQADWADPVFDAKMGALFAPGADTTQFEDYRE